MTENKHNLIIWPVEKPELYLERGLSVYELLTRPGFEKIDGIGGVLRQQPDNEGIEILIINENNLIKDYGSKEQELVNSPKTRPYHVTLRGLKETALPPGSLCNEPELADYIDFYIRNNQNKFPFALVRPCLKDYIESLARK